MELGAAESVELPYCNTIKVHRLMCLELKKLVDHILHMFPVIESSRPRCTSGIQALCSLQLTTDKAKLLIQHCSESSKLYLAITAKSILLKCEKIRKTLECCMNQVQHLVPLQLAAKISGIVDELRSTRFCLDPSEYEAGAVILALLEKDISASDSKMQSEIDALRLAALRLSITSPIALIIENRSIKKLIRKVNDANPIKRKILNYLLHLLKKHGKLIWQLQSRSRIPSEEDDLFSFMELEPGRENEGVTSPGDFLIPETPEQFKCPLSMRVLYDPVIIASGKTFERLWIEKWFNDGNQICPVTNARLEQFFLTPNLAMKGLISKWFLGHGIKVPEHVKPIPSLHSLQKSSSRSIANFGSSALGLQFRLESASLDSVGTESSLASSDGKPNDETTCGLPTVAADSHNERYHHSSMTSSSHGIDAAFLSELDQYSWNSQCKVVENVKGLLEDNDKAQHLTFSSSHVVPVIKFLNYANEICDTKMQKNGAELLLAVFCSSRIELPSCQEDVIYLLASLLESEPAGEALAILEVLSWQKHYKFRIVASGILPSILKVLDSTSPEFYTLALKILRNLSNGSDVGYHIAYLDYIPKLVSFLEDSKVARYSIEIISNICKIEEVTIQVAEANLCTSIAILLETGMKDEHELAVNLLLSICFEKTWFCQMIMTETIIQSLFTIYTNGSSKAKEAALELLGLLEFMMNKDASQSSVLSSILSQSQSCFSSNELRVKKSAPNPFGYLVKKLSRFFHAPF